MSDDAIHRKHVLGVAIYRRRFRAETSLEPADRDFEVAVCNYARKVRMRHDEREGWCGRCVTEWPCVSITDLETAFGVNPDATAQL